jgi:hypothetical protein
MEEEGGGEGGKEGAGRRGERSRQAWTGMEGSSHPALSLTTLCVINRVDRIGNKSDRLPVSITSIMNNYTVIINTQHTVLCMN